MKMVVLDGYCKNHGDISWTPLTALCETVIYDRTTLDELTDRIQGFEIVLSNKVPISAELIAQNPQLRCICIPATGYDHVDCVAARAHGITVCNVPEYGAYSVAQHVFALLLEITNRVSLHDVSVRAGDWCDCLDFCYWKAPLHELCGKTMVIFGDGCKSDNIANIAAAFGMHTLTIPTPENGPPIAQSKEARAAFCCADVVVLNCELSPSTTGMVCADTLHLMKHDATLINVSRGALIVDADLLRALKEGTIGFAALDAVTHEPILPDDPLLCAPNCIINPHIAGCTVECRQKLMDITVQNIRAFLAGTPQNLVY